MDNPIRIFPPGSVLFRPLDACMGYVVVHKGTVRVSLTGENGRAITLYRVRPGEICLQTFGCLVDGRCYSAEGVAETEVALEIVPRADFQRRIVDEPAFRESLFSAVAHRFSDLEQLVEDVALTGFEARLARTLLRLADAQGRVQATHEALAVDMGTGRAAVTRQLARFARHGLVTVGRGRLTIVAMHRMQALAHPEL